jgi:peptide/nickel transport system substrate-binding protein
MSSKLHPLIPEAQEALRKGQISRREFLRFTTLLGLSAAGAQAMAACAPAAPVAPPAPAAEAPAATAVPTAAPATGPIRGGVLRAATRIERVDDPARFSLVSQSHPWRHVFDYLTTTDANGITTPYLLDKWEASDDLKTWTLTLKKGIKFNNGKELVADDVLANFDRWLNPDTGSALLGALSYMARDGQEKVDDYTIRCNLVNPAISLPEQLFHYAACILPKEFGGDITLEPIGTGAFLMEEYVPGERARLVRREDYWRMGEDGKPLPYLDEITMVMLGGDASANLAALKGGQVDTVIEPSVPVWEGVKDDDNFNILSTPTSATRVLRVRVDQDPWKDNNVRLALKHCHNREKILALALRNEGVIGNDSHVAPANAEYCEVEPYPFDIAKAKQLLADAGYADGLDVELTVASDWPESMAYAQALKEDAEQAGLRIKLNTMPATQYWDGWTEFNMGITWWAHRPLAVMLLPQAYIKGEDGNPVPWNESKWTDDEFETLLREAEATLDVAARREIMCKIETIQKERGSICTPFFMNVWGIHDKKFHGIAPSPEEFAIYHEAWKEA